MIKKLWILSLFILPLVVFAQQEAKKETRKERRAKADEKVRKMIKDAESGAIVFNKQSAFLINLNTDGFALGYEKATYKSMRKSSMWWFTLGERKSRKEEKLTSFFTSGAQAGNPYVYGKQNNFYHLRIGFGEQRLLGSKNYTNGVAVQAIYGGGLTLGMLKPYYVEVFDAASNGKINIKYSETDTRFLDPGEIYGAAPFGTGFNELKFVPGAFVKGGFRFDYGRFNEVVSGIEVGIQAEYYTQKMPIMALAKEKNFFVSGYVNLVFGSRR
jgi:hypothetical protein